VLVRPSFLATFSKAGKGLGVIFKGTNLVIIPFLIQNFNA